MEWAAGGDELTVDLEAADDRRPGRTTACAFEMDPFVRHALLNGLDAIGRTLQHEAEIAAFEERVDPPVRRRPRSDPLRGLVSVAGRPRAS